MTTIASFRNSECETTCDKCGNTLIAPEWSEYVIDGLILNLWTCTKCGYRFETEAYKLRHKTGLTDDGATLVDRALAGDLPLIAINALSDDTERSEQRGFVNLIKGIFGMFRNPTAHAPKIKWAVNKDDAEEVLTLLSMVHKRIDASRMLSRV